MRAADCLRVSTVYAGSLPFNTSSCCSSSRTFLLHIHFRHAGSLCTSMFLSDLLLSFSGLNWPRHFHPLNPPFQAIPHLPPTIACAHYWSLPRTPPPLFLPLPASCGLCVTRHYASDVSVADALVESLKENSTLTKLDLSYGSFGEEACLRLSEVLLRRCAIRYGTTEKERVSHLQVLLSYHVRKIRLFATASARLDAT